jgi:hypothetical protein
MDGITAGIAGRGRAAGGGDQRDRGGRNVQEVAMAANQISASITDVSASVDQASEVAAEVRAAAEAMSTEADVLKGDVAGFLGNIRSDLSSLGFDSIQISKLEQMILKHIDEGRYPGAQFALARHGKLAAFRSYGHARTEPARSRRGRTRFSFCSRTPRCW